MLVDGVPTKNNYCCSDWVLFVGVCSRRSNVDKYNISIVSVVSLMNTGFLAACAC